MISLEQYKRVLDSGLLLDHYVVLCNLRDGKEMPRSRRIDGFINLLNKKGYIEDGALTDKAFDVIDVHANIIVEDKHVDTPAFDFGGWVSNLHQKCKDKLIKLTGKQQVTAKINKADRKGYPFMPNLADFSTRIFECIQRYKLKDMDAIEKMVLHHIDECSNTNNWFPLMKYYIHKKGEGSQLVTDLENGVETQGNGNKGLQRFV